MHMRRVRVLGIIRVLVMVAMMIGPPERPALHRGAGPQREEKLAGARGGEGFVREVTVMDARHREHADEIKRDRRPGGKGAHAHPQHAEAADMEDDKRHHAHPIHAIRLVAHLFRPVGAIIGVDPLDDCGGHTAKQPGTGGGGLGGGGLGHVEQLRRNSPTLVQTQASRVSA